MHTSLCFYAVGPVSNYSTKMAFTGPGAYIPDYHIYSACYSISQLIPVVGTNS